MQHRAAPAVADESSEAARIERLHALEALAGEPDAIFDSLVAAAAELCELPMASIALVDGDRHWFKASIGVPMRETSLDSGFSTRVVEARASIVAEDTTRDPRFADNPYVTGAMGVRFYAGAPITLSDGFTIGALCVLGRAPRAFASHQLRTLEHLARTAARAFESREETARALRCAAESAARITSLYRSSPVPLFSMDPHCRLLLVSDAWTAETGYRPEELEGRSIAELLTPASRRKAADADIPTSLASQGTDRREYEIVCKDGSTIEVLVSQVPEFDRAGRLLGSMGAFENITARRAAERALDIERERMKYVLEGVDAGSWELNVTTRALVCNERWAEILGHTLASFGPCDLDRWTALIHPNDLPTAREATRAHYRGHVPYYLFEGRMRHPVDGWIWVRCHGRVSARDAAGRATRMHGMLADISARKRAELMLRESQRFLERVGQIAGVGGWELDLRSGALVWSDQMRTLCDVPDDFRPALDTCILSFASHVRPTVRQAVQDAIERGMPFDLELPFTSGRGRRRWARATGFIDREHGEPVRLVGAFQDITDRKAAELDLARSRELLQVTLDSIGDAVVTTDIAGLVQWLNPVAERMTGWTKGAAVGQRIEDVFVTFDDESGASSDNPVIACLAHREHVGPDRNTTLASRGGLTFGIEDSASPIRDANGQVLGVVLVFRDVSEQRRLNNEMRHRARHDPLTGLKNRIEFETRVTAMLEQAHDEAATHSLLYIDLDQFKLVNDACGHGVGDELLKQVAGILRQCVRGTDTVARLGGDEFGMILEHCDLSCAERVAQKICDEMEAFRFFHEGRRFRIGTSIGLVPLDRRWTAANAVLQAADASCYAAKEGGRNRVHAWLDSDTLVKSRDGDMQWVSRLELALDEDRFVLFGQRIESIDENDDALHLEVLLRMRDIDGSLVPPGAFLPVAERFHLITRVDRWVLRAAFDAMHRATAAGVNIGTMAINLSGQSLVDRAFHRDAIEMIRQATFDVGRICFEITETAAITHLAEARVFIDAIRAHGVKVALDDFGAGASSFGYLKSLPVDFLKIDGHFITNLLEDALNNAAVRCFCDVAKVVGVKTIAEFVECEAVRQELRAIGVDKAQGYLIHRPEPLAMLIAEPVPEALAA